jgi:histidine ammonia-lyase
MPDLVLTGEDLTVAAAAALARRSGVDVAVAPEARARMDVSRRVVERAVADGRVVYGVTTGFGRLADIVVPPADRDRLQQNLVRSHAAGVGPPLAEPVVRTMILLRANALVKGFSGVRPVVVDRLLDLLRCNVVPVVPRWGSVGASGDLAPLAHLALVLTGEGEAWVGGRRLPGEEALRAVHLAPVRLAAKEGLALINGTQMMSAHAVLAVGEADRLADLADWAAALTVDVLRGIPDAFRPEVAAVRPHPGQATSAAHLRACLEGSRLTTRPGQVRVQDAYSLRCTPQVHGAARDALAHVAAVVEREINSATDNPLIFPDGDDVVSAGNFHGEPLALALDYLAIALAEWANVSERRSERMVNPALSGLPPFLVSDGGLRSGLMLAQYTAAALVSHNKVLAHPASVDSIPTSANQEDHVSMGSIAALKVMEIVEHVRRVLLIEAMLGAQAADLVGSGRLAPGTRALYEWVRRYVAPWGDDRPLGPDIERLVRAWEDDPPTPPWGDP